MWHCMQANQFCLSAESHLRRCNGTVTWLYSIRRWSVLATGPLYQFPLHVNQTGLGRTEGRDPHLWKPVQPLKTRKYVFKSRQKSKTKKETRGKLGRELQSNQETSTARWCWVMLLNLLSKAWRWFVISHCPSAPVTPGEGLQMVRDICDMWGCVGPAGHRWYLAQCSGKRWEWEQIEKELKSFLQVWELNDWFFPWAVQTYRGNKIYFLEMTCQQWITDGDGYFILFYFLSPTTLLPFCTVRY